MFDMLGNELEWVQDSTRRQMPSKGWLSNDDINISELISENNPRFLRGGSFFDRPALVRSAFRYWYAPASGFSFHGFRPSRTYN
jgi:formylglycine-generating enzyme required for sulfatase activity